MKRKTKLKKWIEQNGNKDARVLIKSKTGMSDSLLEKLADGRYLYTPHFLVRKVLVEMTNIKEADLFPKVPAKGRRAS